MNSRCNGLLLYGIYEFDRFWVGVGRSSAKLNAIRYIEIRNVILINELI